MVVPKFSRILVPLDGSELSIKAAEYAISIAKKQGDDSGCSFLIALHVVYSSTGYAYSLRLVSPNSIQNLLEKCKQEFQPWFDIIKEKASYNKNDDKTSLQLKTDIILSTTSIVEAIIDYAEREKVDLIVIGTRGMSGFKRMVLGSVANGVVTYASCPVMVVK
jgi:nucleotide-binding universal stress UspA family protein